MCGGAFLDPVAPILGYYLLGTALLGLVTENGAVCTFRSDDRMCFRYIRSSRQALLQSSELCPVERGHPVWNQAKWFFEAQTAIMLVLDAHPLPGPERDRSLRPLYLRCHPDKVQADSGWEQRAEFLMGKIEKAKTLRGAWYAQDW